MDTNEKIKVTQKNLEDYGAEIFTEIANQCGGLDNVEDMHPRDVIPANQITIELVQELMNSHDKLCIVGININE